MNSLLSYICSEWAKRFAVLALGGVLLGGLGASCSGGERAPQSVLKIDLSELPTSDSILYVLRIGEGLQWRDTIARQGETSVELSLDTALVRSVLVSASSREWMKYYKYAREGWAEQLPNVEDLPLDSASARGVYGRDSKGVYRSISSINQGGLAVIAFSNADLKTLSKGEQDSLRKRLGGDRVEFAYLMLTLSDSAALSRLKRDSLKGIAFSDSLGLVSEARRHFGVSRDSAVRLFSLDSLGQIRSLR